MASRRTFIPVGRLIAYVLALAVVAGVFFAFKHYTRSQEEGDVSLGTAAPAELARYLAREHAEAAADPKVFEGGGMKAGKTTDAALLSECTGQWLGTRKTLEDLFETRKAPAFVGARRSSVPGPGPSVQMMFKTDAKGGDAGTVSLFLKKYMESPKQEENTSQSLKSDGPTIVLWRHGGVVYDLVGPAAAVEALRSALGAASPSGEYTGK